MSIDRFASTRIAPRAPWLLIGGAVAAAVWYGHGRLRGHHCHHHDHVHARGPLRELHVELAPSHDVRELRADVELFGGRGVLVGPLFSNPEPALRDWFELRVHGDPDAIAGALRASGVAREAFAIPQIALASIDPGAGGREVAPAAPSCPTRTPSYAELQGYLAPAPEGIDAAAVWAQPGGRGQGVRFADIEGAWNARHEDLPGDRMTLVAGPQIPGRDWEAHGTAVVGEVAGKDNGLGMTGIAPDVDGIVVASIGAGEVADAIDRAQQALGPGDVLLIELQGMGPGGRWIPVEYWADTYDAIKVATARGVVVIEAAGNGAADLDDRMYKGAFDPRKKDSGAIMVGAGGPPRAGFTDRARLDFSNYGRRVDVQGWGRKVATLDYGDLQRCATIDRHYTGEFSGTSSASPIVAGAAVQIEGVYRARTGRPVSPAKLRDVLRATGSPQTAARGAPLSQHIGPRPSVPAALAALGD
jgi:hypothetical protein